MSKEIKQVQEERDPVKDASKYLYNLIMKPTDKMFDILGRRVIINKVPGGYQVMIFFPDNK